MIIIIISIIIIIINISSSSRSIIIIIIIIWCHLDQGGGWAKLNHCLVIEKLERITNLELVSELLGTFRFPWTTTCDAF